jgi:hypothetical protein
MSNKESESTLVVHNTSSNMNVEWTIEHEQILVEWADKAMCYRWLHSRSNFLYSGLNAWYTIPVIIMSTLTGTANFALERVPLQYQGFFSMIVGGINILAGIITTIQQFLKITQLNEAHRVSSIAWDKFYRNIKIELAKHPDERMNVTQMIKISKEEFDRLMETSPNIPDKIIKCFKTEFKNIQNEDMPKIIKPEICDELISTELSRNPWSSDENKIKKISQIINKEKTNIEMIVNFQKTFFELHNREPLESEIVDNLKEKIDVSIIDKSLETIKKNKCVELNLNSQISSKNKNDEKLINMV